MTPCARPVVMSIKKIASVGSPSRRPAHVGEGNTWEAPQRSTWRTDRRTGKRLYNLWRVELLRLKRWRAAVWKASRGGRREGGQRRAAGAPAEIETIEAAHCKLFITSCWSGDTLCVCFVRVGVRKSPKKVPAFDGRASGGDGAHGGILPVAACLAIRVSRATRECISCVCLRATQRKREEKRAAEGWHSEEGVRGGKLDRAKY